MPRLTIFAILLLLLGCAPKQRMLEPNPYLIGEGERPWILAHGGAKDLWPENTMPAFEGSVNDYAVDILEIDVCMTADEVLVPHHDLTIDARSDGSGDLIGYTYTELQQFNFGHHFTPLDQPDTYPYRSNPVRIPTLEEVLNTFRDEVHFVVEIKNRGENGRRAGELLRDLIEATGVSDRVIVASFHQDVLDYFQEITEGEIPLSTAQEETENFVFSSLGNMEFLYRPQAVATQIPTSSAGINLASRDLIESAHRRGMAVHYWTINDKVTMRELIELGADGLITDRPDLMRELLTDMGW